MNICETAKGRVIATDHAQYGFGVDIETLQALEAISLGDKKIMSALKELNGTVLWQGFQYSILPSNKFKVWAAGIPDENFWRRWKRMKDTLKKCGIAPRRSDEDEGWYVNLTLNPYKHYNKLTKEIKDEIESEFLVDTPF